ncbi:inner membrane protein [Kroppenstedtia sanguinis]|uniref:Metal-dependent hydrolase n=1 Tax=Kroppenstedtia sanguinis TaxID=1380684 RepID=A0ABW4C659_9BACL
MLVVIPKGGSKVTGNTHLSLGLTAGAVAVGVTGTGGHVLEAAGMVLIASLGSLVPDIDEDNSILNNLLFKSIRYRSAALAILGTVLALFALLQGMDWWIFFAGVYVAGVAFLPHRSFTHSLVSMGIVTWITYLAHPPYAVAMALGYFSHLLADAVTVGGVPFFWPWKQRIGLKNLGVRIRSGDTIDKVTGKISMYGGCVALIWLFFQETSFDPFFSSFDTVKGLFGWGG